MRRRFAMALALALLAAVALLAAGCSKKKDEETEKSLAEAKARAEELQTKLAELTKQIQDGGLKAAEERRLLEEATRAYEIRLMHQRTDEFKVEPYSPTENGWLVLDGPHTFTLQGHPKATKVQFYWANGNSGLNPELLGEDASGADGWSWHGSLPPGNSKAFWAEVHYPGGIKVTSAVLAVRSGGK